MTFVGSHALSKRLLGYNFKSYINYRSVCLLGVRTSTDKLERKRYTEKESAGKKLRRILQRENRIDISDQKLKLKSWNRAKRKSNTISWPHRRVLVKKRELYRTGRQQSDGPGTIQLREREKRKPCEQDTNTAEAPWWVYNTVYSIKREKVRMYYLEPPSYWVERSGHLIRLKSSSWW